VDDTDQTTQLIAYTNMEGQTIVERVSIDLASLLLNTGLAVSPVLRTVTT
jgi:hypothetical protein